MTEAGYQLADAELRAAQPRGCAMHGPPSALWLARRLCSAPALPWQTKCLRSAVLWRMPTDGVENPV